MATDDTNERDPLEWAQHSALVAISTARMMLDVLEGLVMDRERLERFALSGRSAGPWLSELSHFVGSFVPRGVTRPPMPTPAAPSRPSDEPRTAAGGGSPTARRGATRTGTATASRKRTGGTGARPAPAKRATKKAGQPATRSKRTRA